MTDTDQHADDDLEARLRAAGAAFREQPVPEVAVAWPGNRRSGWLAPLAAAAAVLLVVAGVAIALSLRGHPNPPAAPVQQPSREFAVPAPPSPDYGPRPTGGGIWRYRACAAAAITPSLKTRVTPDGILGLIEVRGVKCGIQVDENRLRLVDAAGAVLPVPLSRGNPLDSTAYYGPGEFGDVLLGFSWTGSYCGPRPAALRILVAGHPVKIPFAGPTPSCHSGTSSLVEGVLGVPGAAVMPAPVSWQSLTAKVVLPQTLTRAPVPLTVEFTNHSRHDISLAVPCPAYQVTVSTNTTGLTNATGPNYATSSQSLSLGDLCARPLTVPRGKPLTVPLGTLTDPPLANAKAGDRVTVTWYMSGIESTPSATATIR